MTDFRDALSRMKTLMQSGEYFNMSDEEAYDAVYGTGPYQGHKAERLRRIKGVTKRNYHIKAIKECGLWGTHPDNWTEPQRRAVATKQRDYRQKLGISEPDASNAPVRPAWTTSGTGLQT